MSGMSFSSGKQHVKPPQRGIFPLDHDSECKPAMERYLECLKQERDLHYKCRDLSKEYLQCRMDRQLMAQEDLNNVSMVCMKGYGMLNQLLLKQKSL
jgi:cytochrome c oxidase assembly protein subunit 19